MDPNHANPSTSTSHGISPTIEDAMKNNPNGSITSEVIHALIHQAKDVITAFRGATPDPSDKVDVPAFEIFVNHANKYTRLASWILNFTKGAADAADHDRNNIAFNILKDFSESMKVPVSTAIDAANEAKAAATRASTNNDIINVARPAAEAVEASVKVLNLYLKVQDFLKIIT